jgi:type IV pilus assembly protein PilC
MPKKLQRKVAPARAVPTDNGATPAAVKERTPLLRGRRVTTPILTEFTTQLAVLLDAGIPIARSLRVLEGQMPPGAMKRVLGELVEDVEGGTSLSESMAKHDRVFDRLYTNMVRAGEAGGIQDQILLRLATFLENAQTLRSRVIGALAYPVAIMCVAAVVLVLVFLFVIPRFKEIFVQQFGGLEQLPTVTRFVINVGDHLTAWWWLYVLVAGLIVTVHRLLLARVPGYRLRRDRLLLGVPLFGALIRKTLVARFAATFGTLVQSGVPHLEALDIVRGSIANMPLGNAVTRIRSSISEGAGIAVPMGESGIFDDVVVNMVDVGEQTGELDGMLAKIARRYETEVGRTVDTLFKIIDPIMLVIMAVVVGVIVFALFSPLLKLMQQIQQR